MNPKAPIPLFPVVLAGAALSLIAFILVFVGFPMAGEASAIICLVVSVVLTLCMAYVFSHGAKTGH